MTGLKLNTDVYYKFNLGLCDGGGILRDRKGKVILDLLVSLDLDQAYW